MLESILADIRFALRWLRKSPGFTLVAVASLAIGIGFNTALFAIVDALLFKPLPVAAPDRLVDVFTSDSTGSVDRSAPRRILTTSTCRRRTRCSTAIVGYSPMLAALNLDNRSRLAMGEIVTGNYFQRLGVARRARPHDPAGGRRAGRRRAWRWCRIATGRASSGRRRTPSAARIRIRGNPYTIVGVAPSGFSGMVPVLSPEMWIPVSASLDVEPVGMHDTVPSPTGTTRLDRRADRWLFMRARLEAGQDDRRRRAPT